jgi:hypothetical protein
MEESSTMLVALEVGTETSVDSAEAGLPAPSAQTTTRLMNIGAEAALQPTSAWATTKQTSREGSSNRAANIYKGVEEEGFRGSVRELRD